MTKQMNELLLSIKARDGFGITMKRYFIIGNLSDAHTQATLPRMHARSHATRMRSRKITNTL